jgi:hypothetical protein
MRASYAITAVDCDTASAQSLEAGNWVVATATSSSRTDRERDGVAAKHKSATETQNCTNKFQRPGGNTEASNFPRPSNESMLNFMCN